MTTTKSLLIDVGNTRLKWGIKDGKRISKTGSLSHESIADKGLATLTARIPNKVSQVLICNVAGPALALKLSALLGLHCGVDVRFAHCEREAFGVTNGYRQPRRLGVDRWVAMIGARAEFGGSLCVVDAGTAVTVDGIDNKGLHLGGQIFPGLDLMRKSLQRDTSDIGLAANVVRSPGDGIAVFGSSTRDAINGGTTMAAAGAIELSAKRMREAGLRPKIVLTGGDASRILKHLNSKAIHRPHLVLQGLATMLMSDT